MLTSVWRCNEDDNFYLDPCQVFLHCSRSNTFAKVSERNVWFFTKALCMCWVKSMSSSPSEVHIHVGIVVIVVVIIVVIVIEVVVAVDIIYHIYDGVQGYQWKRCKRWYWKAIFSKFPALFMSRIFMIKILRCFHWHAFSSLVNVLLWFYLVLACPLPSIENCLLIYYHWLECVTSTGSIMMPIWVLLKMVYVLFLSQHNVPKGAAQMTLWTLCRILEFSHN